MAYYGIVATKACTVCGTEYGRRFSSSGNIESWVDYNKRKYCSVVCRQNRPIPEIIKTRINTTVYEKICNSCGKVFGKHQKVVDARYPLITESTPRFMARKHCSRACYFVSHKMKLQS